MIQEPIQIERQAWMKVLSSVDWSDLEPLLKQYELDSNFQILRMPDTGMVMVRGRMGGTGQPFNAGEATVTRCSVRSANGFTGHAYVLGRNHNHAMAAAKLDAELQDENRRDEINRTVIEPLKRRSLEKRELHRRKTAATKVEFFTMVRGEDD